MPRTHKTEAVVLRSLRFSEADRILHVYTRERGRIGAIAKGVRKTKSRFGARLEALSPAELMLDAALGLAPRAAVARRADAARGLGRAAHRHRRRARPLAPRGARAAVPPERR